MALSTTWALVPTHCPGLGRSEGGASGRAGGAFRVEVCAGRHGRSGWRVRSHPLLAPARCELRKEVAWHWRASWRSGEARPAPDRSGVETWRSGKFMPCRSSRGFQASLMPTWPASQASSCRTPELGHVVAGIDGSGLGLNNELASYRPCRQAVRAREDLRLRPSGSIHSFITWRCRCRCGATRQPS